MRHGSLFSGIGGFDLAAEWAGFQNIFQVEIDPFCRKVLEKNFPNVKRYKDIKEFDGTEYKGAIDIITGGFPCQPFSVARKRKGKEDDRYLWHEMLRILKEAYPEWIVGENVTGILDMGFDQMLSELEGIGYSTQAFVIPACATGSPHRRYRVWILANHKSMDGKFSIKEKDRRGICRSDEFGRCFEQSWLQVASQFCRVDDGFPTELDRNRLKALGNAVVPQIPYVIFEAIKSLNPQHGLPSKD